MTHENIRRKFAGFRIENRPFINGAYVQPRKGRTLVKTSPIDGARITPVPVCDADDVHQAVTQAGEAFRQGVWRHMSVAEKKQVLFRLANLMENDLETLAYLDTLETGRPYANFLQDSIPKAINALRWFTESIDKFYEHCVSTASTNLCLVTHEPLGIVGIITPWNDPLVLALWKITPALLMGNSVVIKPAEQSSFSTLRLAGLAHQAGIPDGVLNVITGPGEETGKALALHPEVRGIFFTGSSETGKKILGYAGNSNMKKVGLECGGKSAFIVSKHCRQLQNAARTLARNMFYNQGQICSAPSRLFVQKSIRQAFLDCLEKELANYLPGDPFALASHVGAIVSQSQHERIMGFIAQGLERGFTAFGPALDPELANCGGYYIAPVVFTDVPQDDPLAQEEIFGPVLVSASFDTLQEAIDLANCTRFGLAASIWTDNLDEALQSARALEAGIVHINSYGEDDMTAPFGGIKESGLGKDKSLFAFDDYSTRKTTWIKLRQGVND
jgi:acyl-CoA reductase-like NAD-dependent aldehyde dehydrogenase